jgi:hypothetical protein
MLGIVCLGLLAAAFPASATTTWQRPKTIDHGWVVDIAPRVATDAAGNRAVVWVTPERGTGWRVNASYKPAGGRWEKKTVLDRGLVTVDRGAPSARVAMDARGDVVVTYVGRGPSHDAAAVWRPAGKGWAAPVTLTKQPLGSLDIDVAIDSAGTATAVWETPGKGICFTYGAADSRWHRAVHLTPTGRTPAVAVNHAGDAVVALEAFDNKTWRLAAVERPAGGVWGTVSWVSEAGSTVLGVPTVAISDLGAVTATWSQLSDSQREVMVSRQAFGAGWSAAQQLSGTGQSSGSVDDPVVAITHGGRAYVLWTERYGAHTVARVTSSGGTGRRWSRPVGLSAGQEHAELPSLAVNGRGDVVAAWDNYHSAVSQTIEAATKPARGPWSAPTVISGKKYPESLEASVAMDAEGQATVVWDSSGVTFSSAVRYTTTTITD